MFERVNRLGDNRHSPKMGLDPREEGNISDFSFFPLLESIP